MKKIINIFLLLLISLTGLSQTEDYSTKANGFVNQVVLTVENGKRYYNTESVDSIDINGSKVTVSQQAGKYTFNNVGGIAFAKAVSELNITEAKGWQESLFVKWALIAGVDNYNVYVKGGNYADFTKIDNQLVRN